MKPVLEIQHVSKSYQIRHQSPTYLTFRDEFQRFLKRDSRTAEDFLALNDVSLNVHPGESVGIIGRNGAGKSTLLKIISRIVAPAKGRIITRGRIGSLLEVGTGFHPELTGRENIFFNGSLLGMKRREIENKFDSIVDFSGVEKFLDTPLKHYSSGMQLRLAFAVAAFLETEIMIIDEVLAVGDAEFQKKCLVKMEDVHHDGRTILFVSHNMAAVQNLCKKGVVLKNGAVNFEGPSGDAVAHYLNSIQNNDQAVNDPARDLKNSIVNKVEVLCDGNRGLAPYMGCKLEVRVHFNNQSPMEYPVLGLIFKDSYNLPLLAINNKHYLGNIATKPLTSGVLSMTIPYLTLFAGNYFVDVHFGNAFRDLEVHRDCLQIKIEPMIFSSGGELPDRQYNRIFIKDILWNLTRDDRFAEENNS